MDKKITPAHPLYPACEKARQLREELKESHFTDHIVTDLYHEAQTIADKAVTRTPRTKKGWQTRLDDLCTSRFTGYPIMLLLLCAVFWITIEGANVPSAMLASALFSFQDQLTLWFAAAGAPAWLHGLLVLGMYRSLAWVVSVMLPPMAIFFPLFTLLEDLGYLPRVAFNMDCAFKRCCASGKQVLTMCMVAARMPKAPRTLAGLLFSTLWYLFLWNSPDSVPARPARSARLPPLPCD